MKPIKLIVKSRNDKYPILIGPNLILNLSKIFKDNLINFNKCLFVVDRNVPKNFLPKIKKSLKKKEVYFHLIRVSEKNKNLKTSNKIVEILLDKNFSRQDSLVAIGGGITGDIGAFAASIFKRGLNFINIPTTLLSQVDSSVGGKTGVNTKHGKNLIGTFYQPKLVISDSNFLKTLPHREIVCGYGEILKHSLIANKNFFKFLHIYSSDILKLKSPKLEKAIFESCKIKRDIVEKDEKEKNIRKILNFGHTFAHAFEASLGYSKKLNHGEAVILGINMALKFSLTNKLLNEKDYFTVTNHLKNLNLPLDLKNYFKIKDLNKIISFMEKDKKNNSKKINLILLKKINYPIIDKFFDKSKIRTFLKKELIN